jgi:hypothetical protein
MIHQKDRGLLFAQLLHTDFFTVEMRSVEIRGGNDAQKRTPEKSLAHRLFSLVGRERGYFGKAFFLDLDLHPGMLLFKKSLSLFYHMRARVASGNVAFFVTSAKKRRKT